MKTPLLNLCCYSIFIFIFSSKTYSQVVDPREIVYYPKQSTKLDVYGFDNVLRPDLYSNSTYLYIAAVTVRDDGENDFFGAVMGTADIGIRIYGGEFYDQLLFSNRLYGPFYQGLDVDGSLKYEWDDYWSVFYNNFCVLNVSNYSWNCMRIILEEGDEVGSDDVVYDGYVCLNSISETAFMSFPRKCDIIDKCASIWFIKKQAYGNGQMIGQFW